MVTLKAPPSAAIVSWPVLLAHLVKLNSYISNQHRRNHFPRCIVATEFDPVVVDGVEVFGAAFHIGFADPLTDVQQAAFQQWWHRLWNLSHNQGRHFQHDSEGGGQQLVDYLAKDVTFRHRQPRPVKFRPPWMPQRIEKRLWFCVGLKRCPAKQGRELRASTGRILKRFDSEHAIPTQRRLKASTRTNDSEHASPLITADDKPEDTTNPQPVATLPPLHVAAVNPDSLNIIETPQGRFCRRCWNAGRALSPTCCRCTGDVE